MRDELELFRGLIDPVLQANTVHCRVHSSFEVVVPRGWMFENRRNEDLHMVFVRGGKGHYIVQDRRIELHRGRVVFVAARCTHSAYQNAADPPEIIPIRFGFYSNQNRRRIEHSPGGFSLDFVPKDVRLFESLFEALHTSHQHNPDGLGGRLSAALLDRILIEIRRDVSDRHGKRRFDERLEKARQYLETHPYDAMDIDHLASICNLTPKYLSKCFKQQYGMSPRTYLLHAKMNIAFFLVQHSGKPIKEIATDMGYADPYTFSKQFKRVFDIAPSEAQDRFATPD